MMEVSALLMRSSREKNKIEKSESVGRIENDVVGVRRSRMIRGLIEKGRVRVRANLESPRFCQKLYPKGWFEWLLPSYYKTKK